MATRRYRKKSRSSRKRTNTMRRKRGGSGLAATISQALLPASLLGVQMTYPSKRSMRKSKKSRKPRR